MISVDAGFPKVQAKATTSVAITAGGPGRWVVVLVSGAAGGAVTHSVSGDVSGNYLAVNDEAGALYRVTLFARWYPDTANETLTLTTNASFGGWAIYSIAGALGSNLGAIGATHSATGSTLSVDLTSQAANSYVVGGFGCNTTAAWSSTGAGTTIDSATSDWTNNDYFVGHRTSLTPNAGSTETISFTATGSETYGGVSLEVLEHVATDSESITLSEANSVYGPVRITPQTALQHTGFQEDAFQIAAATATGPQPFSHGQQESAALAETEQASQKATAGEADALSLAETEAVGLKTPNAQSEAAGYAEAQTSRQGFAASLSEALALADSYEAALFSPTGGATDNAQSEALAAAETEQARQGYAASQSEAVALADAYAVDLQQSQATQTDNEQAEAIAFGDACAASVAYASGQVEAMAWRDREAATPGGGAPPVTPQHGGGTLRLHGTLRARILRGGS